MKNRLLTTLVLTATTVTLAGCSDRSVSAPAAPRAARSSGAAVPGSYVLSFHTSGSYTEHVASAPVGTELGVRATVRNSLGELATVGSVTFERCTLNGAGAPSATCDGGAGVWKRIMSVRMFESGTPPTISGGWCSSPTTIGFRFKYSGQSGGIASGTSESMDFSWVAVS